MPIARPPVGLPALMALAVATAGAQQTAATAVKVDADWFSCRGGKYAVTLSTHYPSLFNIGKHKVADAELRLADGSLHAVRRIRYFGLELDVAVSPRDPTRYQLVRAEVFSRRWNIGRLSVGERPWRWGREKSLQRTPLDGWIELVGDGDSVVLLMNDGRVDRAIFHCRPPRPH